MKMTGKPLCVCVRVFEMFSCIFLVVVVKMMIKIELQTNKFYP